MSTPKHETSVLRSIDGALVENWFVACLSKDLKSSKPLATTIYDEALVVFRDTNGGVVCLPDRCLHRGAKLSQGTVSNMGITCPYHGWTFGHRGEVVAIPTQRCANAMQLKPKPCIELGGYVWVWMGSEVPPASKEKPRWLHPIVEGLRWATFQQTFTFKSSNLALMQNFTDVPHTAFVHRGLFRRIQNVKVPMKIRTHRNYIECVYENSNDRVGLIDRVLNPSGSVVSHTDYFYMPNIARVDYQFGKSSAIFISTQCTPITFGRAILYTTFSFKIGWFARFLKPLLRAYTAAIMQQDVAVLAGQFENIGHEKSGIFASTSCDRLQVEIEKMIRRGIEGDNMEADSIRDYRAEMWM